MQIEDTGSPDNLAAPPSDPTDGAPTSVPDVPPPDAPTEEVDPTQAVRDAMGRPEGDKASGSR